MPTVDDVFKRYHELRDYCDAFWSRVHAAYPGQFACAAGCGTCCTLTSVNRLEAAVIAQFCGAGNKLSLSHDGGDSCPFLADDRCTIYEARPLICRTHGLLLRNVHFSQPILPSCPSNFATMDFSAVPPALALDSEKVSMNLARLNAAFCMLTGEKADPAERIPLAKLAAET